jgi:predicted DNA-binding protein (MmcQ/YjbR family)
MAHPKMYSDDDPFLAELREVALAFPEAVEVEAWGRPTFRAGKIFALYSGIEDRPYGVIFKPDADDRHALLEDDRFYAPPYYGPSGWLTLDFEAAPVDWDEVGELLDASYRQIALKRQLKALDARADAH